MVLFLFKYLFYSGKGYLHCISNYNYLYLDYICSLFKQNYMIYQSLVGINSAVSISQMYG